MKYEKLRRHYVAPLMKSLALSIEKGFAASLENPETDPEMPW